MPVMKHCWKKALVTLVLLAVGATAWGGQSIAFTWNTSMTNIAGYKIYYGAASRTYTNSLNVGNLPDFTISGLKPGLTYFLAATTYDSVGVESAYSAEISLVIPLSGTNPPPVVTLTAPVNGANYAAPATLNLAAAVTANNHTITKVQFYNGSTLLGEVATAPYEFAWNGVAVGSYTLTARTVFDSTNTVDSAPVSVSVSPSTATRYNFTQADRASLLAGGWDFLARTAAGASRNTEMTSGAVVDYDQVRHPGTLRIPCDAGDLWESINDTRNSLFRNLPADWTSIRVKLAFAPTQNTEQASIVAYQDDDNYLQVSREFNGGNKISFVREIRAAASGLQSAAVTATTNLHLRLDREAATGTFSAFYSLNSTTWLPLGTAVQTLVNPRIGIIVCSSPGGYPNAEISWVEVLAPQANPVLTVAATTLDFAASQGSSPATQSLAIGNSGTGSLVWTASADATAPAWLAVSPLTGTNNGSVTVSVNSSALAAGSYTKNLTITAPGATNSPQTITVNLTVSNPPPTITLTAPTNNASYAVSATINLAATVTANGQSITKVQFFTDATLLGEDATAPYNFTLTNVAAGDCNLTARVVYNAGSTEDSAPVTVKIINAPPTLDALSDLTLNEDAAQKTVALSGITAGATNEVQTLTLTAISSNPALIPNPTVIYTSPGTNGSIKFTPKANAFGTATISVTVNDGQAASNTIVRAFTVTVNPANDVPTLSALTALTINEDAATQTVALAGISMGQTNEAQTITVTATSSNPALIPNPTVNYISPNATGSLTFAPRGNAFGTATITVTVNDGGASNNTVNRTFTVMVNPVNDTPTLGALANLTIDTGAPQQTVALAGITSGATNEVQTLTVTAASSNPALIPAPTITYTSPGTNGSIKFTPVSGASGLATITVTVNDGGTSNNLVARSFTVTVSAPAKPLAPLVAQLSLGSALLQAGQSTNVPLNFSSSAGVVDLDVLLVLPSDRLTNLAVQALAPEIDLAASTLTPQADNTWLLHLAAKAGQTIAGGGAIAELEFTAVTDQRSGIMPLTAQSFSATANTGARITDQPGQSGRAVIIAEESLLELGRNADGSPALTVYGKPDRSYAVEYSAHLGGSALWTRLSAPLGTNSIAKPVTGLVAPAGNVFYRAVELLP